MESLIHSQSKKRLKLVDIAEELQIKKFVLRLWEREFSLKLSLDSQRHNTYTDKELALFRYIKTLVYDHKLPLEEVKKRVQNYVDTPGEGVFCMSNNPSTSDQYVLGAIKEEENCINNAQREMHSRFYEELVFFKQELERFKKLLEL